MREQPLAPFLNLVNFLSVSLILIVIMVEIFGARIFDFDIFDYVPRSKENTAGLGAGLIKRAYGFSTEPTQVGNYLLTCGLLAISYTLQHHRSSISLIFLGFWLFGLLLTFSAASMVLLGLNLFALILFGLPRFKSSYQKWFIKKRSVKYFFGTCLITWIFLTFTNILNNAIVIAAFAKILSKITVTQNNVSAIQRLDMFKYSFSLFSESPLIGFGFGYLSSKDLMSPINWYLMLLAEGGSISFILMMLVLALLFSNVSFGKLNLLAKMSLFNGLSYLVFMSTFYSMGLWVALFLCIGTSRNDSRD